MKRIKLSLLKSMLHTSILFDTYTSNFLKSIENSLGLKLELSDMEDYDCDLKLIFIASGGSEGLFLSEMDRLKPPYYLLTSGANNSLAASMEILTYLNNNNLEGEVIHGDISYITERISALLNKEGNEEYERLGIIGRPSDWLISSIPDYDKIRNKFSLEPVDIDLNEVIRKYNNLSMPDTYGSNDSFDPGELNNAERFYLALNDIKSEYNLKGLTIRCFDLLDSIKMTGCLALSKLNDMGVPSACEGDIMALISMYLINKWFSAPSFMANPSRIDVLNNEIVLAHCTIPSKMLESFKFETHFESGIGVAIKGELKLSPCTVFRLSSDLKSYFLEEGMIVSNLNENNLCRTQIKIRMNNLASLLKNPCGNHHIVFYGHHKTEMEELLKEYYK